jgi:predicted acetyltransferase
MAIEIRTPPADQLRHFLEIGGKTFSEALRPEDAERDERVLDPTRLFAAYDGDAMVGTAADFGLALTVPGGELPAAGVTLVGVLPTHRRRGILNQLMRAEIDAMVARGEPLAILWASEEAIYGRYGYGMATLRGSIEADRDGRPLSRRASSGDTSSASTWSRRSRRGCCLPTMRCSCS